MRPDPRPGAPDIVQICCICVTLNLTYRNKGALRKLAGLAHK